MTPAGTGCDAPIVLLITFNRPAETSRAIKALAKCKPPQVLVCSDGPRPDHPADSMQIRQVREAISREITWECSIEWLQRGQNVGAKQHITESISKACEISTSVIVLEDDVIIDPSTYAFFKEMLVRYARDEQVMGICSWPGLQSRHVPDSPYDYFFSRYFSPWGWATWRRAWSPHTVDQPVDFKRLSRELRAIGGFSLPVRRFWARLYAKAERSLHTWSHGWQLRVWRAGWLFIRPYANLSRNEGFGPNATMTVNESHFMADLRIEPLPHPLSHPPLIRRSSAIDKQIERLTSGAGWLLEVKLLVKRLLLTVGTARCHLQRAGGSAW